MLKLIKLGRLNWFLRIVGVLLFYYLFLLIWNIIKKFWIVRMYYTNYRGGMFKTHQNFFHIGYQEPGTAVVKQGQDLLHRKLIFKHTMNLFELLKWNCKDSRLKYPWHHYLFFLPPIESEWILNFCQKHHDIFGKLSIWLSCSKSSIWQQVLSNKINVFSFQSYISYSSWKTGEKGRLWNFKLSKEKECGLSIESE